MGSVEKQLGWIPRVWSRLCEGPSCEAARAEWGGRRWAVGGNVDISPGNWVGTQAGSAAKYFGVVEQG